MSQRDCYLLFAPASHDLSRLNEATVTEVSNVMLKLINANLNKVYFK